MKKIFLLMLLLVINNFLSKSQNIVMIKDINPYGDANPAYLSTAKYSAAMNQTVERLFFSALDSINSVGVFITDGTQGNVLKIKNIIGSDFQSLYLISFGYPKVLFNGIDNTHGSELWITNGTALGTNLLLDIIPGPGSSSPSNLLYNNYKIFFGAYSSSTQRSLYYTQGTQNTTNIIKSFSLNDNDSYNMLYDLKLLTSQNKILFKGYTQETGLELWISDGTPEGTSLLKDIYPGSNGGISYATNNLYVNTYIEGIEYNEKFYFSANDGSTGFELWVTDGTSAGTQLVKNLAPGISGSRPHNFFIYNNLLHFFAIIDTSLCLVTTDGTTANTIIRNTYSSTYWLRHGIVYNDYYYYFSSINGSDLCIYRVNLNTYERELFQYFENSTTPREFKIYNGYLYYSAAGPMGVSQLWRTNGTPENTIIITPEGIAPFGGEPRNFTEYNGSLYFSAMYTSDGFELWKLTDSTMLLPPTFQMINISKISPTVTKDFIYINSDSKFFYFFNTLGTKILELKNIDPKIDVSNLPSGLYLVTDENNTLIGKFIKF